MDMTQSVPPRPRSVFAPVEAKLLSDKERAQLVREHGDALAGHVDAVVQARAQEFALGNLAAMAKMFVPADHTAPLLLSHADAAYALGVSESQIKRMVVDGRLPKPAKISAHRIGHRWSDLVAFADSIGRKIEKPKR
jgi:predicted DNA-binding transcriptional regulator AlpA